MLREHAATECTQLTKMRCAKKRPAQNSEKSTLHNTATSE